MYPPTIKLSRFATKTNFNIGPFSFIKNLNKTNSVVKTTISIIIKQATIYKKY